MGLAPLHVALRWSGVHDSHTAAMLVAVEDATGLALGPGDPLGIVALAKIGTRLEAELPRLQRSLGDAPACPLCGSRKTHGHTEHALRVVQGDDGLGLDVTLTRFCRHCTRGAPVPVGDAGLLIGDNPEGADAALELMHRSSVPAARARAVLRRAVARSATATTTEEQAAPLVAAIETFVDRMSATGPELDGVVQRLRSIAQDAPRYARWIDAVLSRATAPPRSDVPQSTTRRCLACDELKHRATSAPISGRGRRAAAWIASAPIARGITKSGSTRPLRPPPSGTHWRPTAVWSARASTRPQRPPPSGTHWRPTAGWSARASTHELDAATQPPSWADIDRYICFETTEVPQRVVLHANPLACAACHRDLLHYGMTTCPLCRDAVCL